MNRLVIVAAFAFALVASTQVLCEELPKQELPAQLTPTDLLKLDNAQTQIREVMLQAQLAILPHNTVVQEVCKTYKIVPCDNLDKIIDMSTGRIKRSPVAPTAPHPVPPSPSQTKAPAQPKAKGGTP